MRLAEECGQTALKALNPTFLVDYGKIILQPVIKEKYLSIYIEADLTVEEEEYIRATAHQYHLKIPAQHTLTR